MGTKLRRALIFICCYGYAVPLVHLIDREGSVVLALLALYLLLLLMSSLVAFVLWRKRTVDFELWAVPVLIVLAELAGWGAEWPWNAVTHYSTTSIVLMTTLLAAG